MAPNWFQRFTSAASSSHMVKIVGKYIHYRRWSGQGSLQKTAEGSLQKTAEGSLQKTAEGSFQKTAEGSLQKTAEGSFQKTAEGSFQKPLKALPGLLFVHGYGAHSHWWDFIAPAFIGNFDVVAMDMSGAGDSEHRQIYKATTFANEIIGVCKDAQLQSTIVVGHSFGGSMTRVAAYLNGNELAGVVLVDTMLSRHRSKRTPPPRPRTRNRYYDSLAEGARRFRLRPPQPCANKYILDYIARHSLAKGENGYYFTLDQTLFSRMREDFDEELPDAFTMTAQSKCPVGIVYGENSRLFPTESVAVLKEVIREDLIQCIPDSHHHVFLDQPLAFIDALKIILPRLYGEP